MEVAYLASACLEAVKRGRVSAKELLVELAISFDPDTSGITERAVRKAIEEGVLKPLYGERVLLEPSAVAYLATTKSLEAVSLGTDAKARLYDLIMSGSAELELAPGVSLDLRKLIRSGESLIESYRAFDRYVRIDTEVMGGLPTIRKTRIPVYTCSVASKRARR